jgi:aspartate aminotransferase
MTLMNISEACQSVQEGRLKALFEGSDRARAIKPSAIRRMLELSAGMKNVIHLEQGEPDFKTPEHIVEAATNAAEKGFTHYTEVDGTLELRQAIA